MNFIDINHQIAVESIEIILDNSVMPKRKKLVPRNMTKFNVPCAFGGQASEVAIFIGNPEAKHHPIHFQSKFIQDVRGGVIPQSVLDSLEKLKKLSIENGVPFEELCQYALSSIANNNQVNNTTATPSVEATNENTIHDNNSTKEITKDDNENQNK